LVTVGDHTGDGVTVAEWVAVIVTYAIPSNDPAVTVAAPMDEPYGKRMRVPVGSIATAVSVDGCGVSV